ncbi:MAG: PEP-CTERM sorting domain-containing protein [Betaproteobacteria bacterium]
MSAIRLIIGRILPIAVSFSALGMSPARAEIPTLEVAAAAAAFVAPTIDPTKVWDGSIARWSNPTNWNPTGLPEAADRVLVGNGGSVSAISFNAIDAAMTALTIYGGDAAAAGLRSVFWQSPAAPRSLVVTEALVIGGASANERGALLLSGGVLSTLDTWVVSTPADGTDEFRQTGGVHTASSRLILSPVDANARAQYTLADGALRTGSTILDAQSGGAAQFNHEGGTHTTGALEVGKGATYRLQGTGSLDAKTVTNTGTISVEGGAIATATLVNTGEFSFVGGKHEMAGSVQNGGLYQILNGGDVVHTGAFVNDGTARILGSTAAFTTMTNRGHLDVDPSTVSFVDLTVGTRGWITATAGDRFLIQNSFVNHSARADLWSTGAAILEFTGVGERSLLTPGSAAFGWGELVIDDGAIVQLGDGDVVPGGGFYAGKLTGLKIEGNVVTNVYGNGVGLYYNPALNPDLAGLALTLADGGTLAAIPEPATHALLAAGLVLIIGLALRRRTGGRPAAWRMATSPG